MKVLIGLALFLTTCIMGDAQTTEEANKTALNTFVDAYNAQDFARMRETFGGPLKLIFTEKRLEQMFGGQFAQMGSMRTSSLVWKQSSVRGGLVFQRDTTEQMNFGISFSKKSKIIGLGNPAPKYKYTKQPARVASQTDILRIDSLVQHKHAAAGFSGCVVVIDRDSIVYENCYGKCSYPDGTELTPGVPFEIASCSKAFTAGAIALLEQEGKLQYNGLISDIIPELKLYKGVTIQDLLWHTGGIPDYMELFAQHWDKTRIAKNEDVVALLAKYKPKKYFKPGTKHEYSNTGYVLLAVIVERLCGLPFETFMQNEVFVKAGMKSAFLFNHRRTENVWRSDYAYGYIYDMNTKVNTLPDSIASYDYVNYLDGITGDGMVNVNVRDMLLWDRALRKPGMFTQKTLDRIFTSGATAKGESFGYGYGWEIQAAEGFERMASHSGSWPGYTSYVLRFLDRERTVVIFSNNEYVFMQGMANRIARILE
jgi:CubicO group peptidase (beta-lactamase class C family)